MERQPSEGRGNAMVADNAELVCLVNLGGGLSADMMGLFSKKDIT